MNYEENFQNLKDVYDELLNERKEINNQININLDDIRKIELYLESLFDRENKEYEVFSPRNIQSVFKEEIQSNKLLKQNIVENNEVLYKQNHLYDNKIKKILLVLNNIETENKKNKILENVLSDEEKKSSSKIVNNSCVKEISDDKAKVLNIDDIEIKESVNLIEPLEKNKINYTILDIQEKERQRIARDLHDSTVQNLTHLIHKIELSSKFIDQDTIRAKMELISINKNVKTIIDDMRNTIFNLRPMEFDDIGITAAFDKLLMELKTKTKMTVEFNIQNIEIEDKLLMVSIFHVVQECCNNAIKHSAGNLLSVDIKQTENQLYIIILDDGIGFDLERKIEDKHFGLTMAKERVSLLYGKMKIQTEHSKGTKISISIPI